MSHQIIKQPNGKYAVFSSIVDNFILFNCSKHDLITYYIEKEAENIKKDITEKVMQVELGEKPYAQFTKTWEEALERIDTVHGEGTATKLLQEHSL